MKPVRYLTATFLLLASTSLFAGSCIGKAKCRLGSDDIFRIRFADELSEELQTRHAELSSEQVLAILIELNQRYRETERNGLLSQNGAKAQFDIIALEEPEALRIDSLNALRILFAENEVSSVTADIGIEEKDLDLNTIFLSLTAFFEDYKAGDDEMSLADRRHRFIEIYHAN